MPRSNFGRPGLFAPRNLIAIGAVVVVVLGAFLLLRTMGNSAPAPAPEVVVEEAPTPPPAAPAEEAAPPEPTFPTVLVATQDIRPGVLLTTEMMRWQEWRESLSVEFAVVKDAVDMRQVLGSVTLHPINEGALVSFDRVIRPGHPAFITAVLRPGHRAVTVEVDTATTAAKIIYPGDHVDVIMVLDAGRFADIGAAAQVLVRNVRVLAVGSSSLELGRFHAPQLAGLDRPTPPEGETYTLEVTPTDAERLVLGGANGRLTLAMRSIAQQTTAYGPGRRLTRLGELLSLPDEDDAEGETPQSVLPPTVRVIRGGDARSQTEVATPAPVAEPEPQAAPARSPA